MFFPTSDIVSHNKQRFLSNFASSSRLMAAFVVGKGSAQLILTPPMRWAFIVKVLEETKLEGRRFSEVESAGTWLSQKKLTIVLLKKVPIFLHGQEVLPHWCKNKDALTSGSSLMKRFIVMGYPRTTIPVFARIRVRFYLYVAASCHSRPILVRIPRRGK